jgi:hypothetical protein
VLHFIYVCAMMMMQSLHACTHSSACLNPSTVSDWNSCAQSTGESVTVFRLAKKATPPLHVEAGQRGFQKLRMLRHPYILACLDGAELDTDMVMATEEVTCSEVT